MATKMLVIGGTGMLGRPVAEQLRSDGFDVAVMSTNPDRARQTLGDRFRIVPGDVTDIESLKVAIEGHDCVYLNLNSQLDPEKYESIEIDGTAYVAAVSAAMGVKRIGMISGASSKGQEGGVIYLDAKVKAEKAVMASSVPYVIMRPTWFYESLPGFIQRGRAAILGDQPAEFAWLAVADYARQVSAAFRTDDAVNRCFYCLGPERITMLEALTRFCQKHYPELEPEVVSFGKARLLSHLPGMGALKRLVPFFEYFSEYSEDGDPSEADRLLGANTTTLDEWIDRWQKPA